MNLGQPVFSISRYNTNQIAFFARWAKEQDLDSFLQTVEHKNFQQGWHVRMRPYRQWGSLNELEGSTIDPSLRSEKGPVVAVTLARLNLFETRRFIRWGKPVERQVRDHQGKAIALAGIRPWNTFSTFSIWKNEAEMLKMVNGNSSQTDGGSHRSAMAERERKDFHFQFTTFRFRPISEQGQWRGIARFIF